MKYHTDGYTIKSNPSTLGGGWTLCNEVGNLIETRQIKKKHFTSNEAELLGFLRACELAHNEDEIVTDSMNTIYWTKSGKPKARKDLTGFCQKAKTIIKEKKLKITWKPREENWAGVYNEYHYGK